MIDWSKIKEVKEKEGNVFHVIISGDRSFNEDEFYTYALGESITVMSGKELLDKVVSNMINTVNDKYESTVVFANDANGASRIAIDWALSHDIDVYKYETDWETDGKSAGFKCNETMFTHVSLKKNKAAILFWDGFDKITKSLIGMAGSWGVPLYVYNYKTCMIVPHKEIEEIQWLEGVNN